MKWTSLEKGKSAVKDKILGNSESRVAKLRVFQEHLTALALP